MQLPKERDTAFESAKSMALESGRKDIYEALVVQYTNPHGEWGHNNMRDLVTLFHMSGQTNEQIYNILYNMGIDKERAYFAIQTYIPQKNTSEMTVKEKLDFTGNLRNLVDAMNEYKSEDSANYNADAVIKVCEAYMNVRKDDLTPSQLAEMGRRAVSNLNQYDFISAVQECITSIESAMYEHLMTIEVDSAHSELANSNANGMYNGVIDRLKTLKEMKEDEIRNRVSDDMGPFKTWVPRVKVLLERAEMIEGVKPENKVQTLSERFNLKGKIKKISEKVKTVETEESKFTVKSIREICERYLNKLYSNQNSVSEAQIATSLYGELSQFAWLDVVKENLKPITDFLQENYMSFEVDVVLRNLQKTNERSFYSPAIEKLQEIKTLNEEEIREQIKYGMDSLTWVPQIKYLIETVNSLEGNLSENSEAAIIRKYSPLIEQDGSMYFYLSGGVYAIKENEITTVDPKTMGALFLTLISVTENFKFGAGTLKYYKGDHSIEFTRTEDKTKFSVSGKEVEVSESNDIRNFLLTAGVFRINETSELDMVVKAYENIDKFVELDFVHSVNSRVYEGVQANVIKLGDKIYINRINPSMRVNEMIEAESATRAIELVKEYINYDISATVVELLEGEAKVAAELSAKKNSLFDRIQFLKEQRSRLAEQDINNDVIQEADKLIVQEIEKWQKELNELTAQEA